MTCLFKTKTKFDHVSILITSYFHNSQPLCSRCHCLGCQCNSTRGILYDSYFVIQRIWHLYVKSVLQRWIMSTKDSLSFHQYGCHVFIIWIPVCQTANPWFLPCQISGTACRIANYLGIFSVVIGLNRIFWSKQSQLQLQKALRFTIYNQLFYNDIYLPQEGRQVIFWGITKKLTLKKEILKFKKLGLGLGLGLVSFGGC